MPLVAFAALAVPQLGAAEIRDRAGIFSSGAVKKAEAELDRIERRTQDPGCDRDDRGDSRSWAGFLGIRKTNGGRAARRAASQGDRL